MEVFEACHDSWRTIGFSVFVLQGHEVLRLFVVGLMLQVACSDLESFLVALEDWDQVDMSILDNIMIWLLSVDLAKSGFESLKIGQLAPQTVGKWNKLGIWFLRHNDKHCGPFAHAPATALIPELQDMGTGGIRTLNGSSSSGIGVLGCLARNGMKSFTDPEGS